MTPSPSLALDAVELVRFLESVGLDSSSAIGAGSSEFAGRLDALARGEFAVPASDDELLALWSYRVPELSTDGACSLTHQLAAEPFDLRAPELRALDPGSLRAHPETLRLARLNAIAEALHAETRSDWTGIYRRVKRAEASDALRKEAYRGRPSRALFPLTEEFARQSNNSTAALTLRAIVVEDVDEHVRAGRPYYECDAEVRSELCLPIVSDGRAIGLLDLESFAPRAFGRDATLAASLVALTLVGAGLLPSD